MMLVKKIVILMIIATSFKCLANQKDIAIKYTVLLEQENKPTLTVAEISTYTQKITKIVDGIKVEIAITNLKGQTRVLVAAHSKKPRNAFITIQSSYDFGELYSYIGLESKQILFRQSPHDPLNHIFPNLQTQSVPMAAIKTGNQFTILINDAPAFYDNFTTQFLDPVNKTASISSGDNGKNFSNLPPDATIKSYYPLISAQNPHYFNAIIVNSLATNINDLRAETLKAITVRWGEKEIVNRFYATSFASNYMLLRRNEKNNSTYWVVPGIAYANKQYSRDAFWQSMVLPAKFEAECYKNEAVDQTPGAERPLFALIWAFRVLKNGGKPDLNAAKKSLAYIEAHVRNGKYYSLNEVKKKNFQSWYDLVAFEDDDVLSYNQGLLAVALMSAEKLGLQSNISLDLVKANYQGMFNSEKGYYPLSEKKNLICLDAVVGDLLSQLLFNTKLLPSSDVQRSFLNAKELLKTPFGYKITANPNGSYASPTDYSIPGFTVDAGENGGVGNYQWGGSWYLYNMLFLINAYLHNSPGAIDEVIWRGKLDFEIGGTYFEYINTVTGIPYKSNQGWNAAVYAIWQQLIDRGVADDQLFKAIDLVDKK